MKIKRFILLLVIVCTALTTTNGQTRKGNTDSQKSANAPNQIPEKANRRQFCFIQASGYKNLDTIRFRLLIRGNKAMGELLFLPLKGPRQTGIISGTANGNKITCKYDYSMLRTESSEEQVWELRNGSIVLQSTKTTRKTQQRKLPLTLNQVDCKTFR